MSRTCLRVASAICALAVISLLPPFSTEVQAQAAAVDPEAVEILHRTTEYLGSLEQFSTHAWNLREDELDSGHRVDYEISGRVTIRRPDKLRGERREAGLREDIYYDGKSVTLYNETEQYYMTQPAPATIDEMLRFVYQYAELYPVSDLIWHDSFPWLMQGVEVARIIGTEVIQGISTTHLLFIRPDVEFQIWVPESGPPLPVKYIVTDNSTPEMLSIVTYLSDWNLEPNAPDEFFEFVPPEGTEEVPFPELDAADAPSR